MITVDTQIHGYRQGHQLLCGSATLPRTDQAIVDRLSDVAGPLRPGEIFEPYLSAYPLPSGLQYVLARTWQDLTVPRAGCVRTLSLLIPSSAWGSARALKPFFDLLDPVTFPSAADPITISDSPALPLPPSLPFRAGELLEALFLEEPKPVAIFDAPLPELITLRLLTALWPSLRGRFALSTFALSPRKIEGRNFDLVFSPKDARPKFADWSGRRVDARAGQGARHRWTNAIVDRVFNEPIPRLLGDKELSWIGVDESNTASALRIALLWEELLIKLEHSPSAALGLLDIANSRMQGDAEVILMLRPVLADAAQRAVTSLSASEAWDLIGAMARKMHGTRLGPDVSSVAAAAAMLADRSPSGAVALLDQPDPHGALDTLVPAIAGGINQHFGEATEQALGNASPDTLAHLLCADQRLAQTIVGRPAMIDRLAKVLSEVDPLLFDAVREALLPLLINDSQLSVVRPLLASLDADQLMAEVQHLAEANAFEAASFVLPLVERARSLSVIGRLRDLLLTIPVAPRRDQFLRATLRPTADDFFWLMEKDWLKAETAAPIVLDLLRSTDAEQFRSLLSHGPLAQAILRDISVEGADILLRAVTEVQLPLALHVATIVRLLPASSDRERVDLAARALDRCLRDHFGADEVPAVAMLLGVVGTHLDGTWVVWRGLERGVVASVVNRNLIAFHQAPPAARGRIVGAIQDLARALEGRYSIELDEPAANACAQILWDAQSVNVSGLLSASGRLLPMLLRERRVPVSAMIAATFPSVYRELAREDDVPDLLKFVPFVDWDRCKAARRELVSAFLASPVWKPSDLALTACRSSDVDKVLKRVANSTGGRAYIESILGELTRLPVACREQVMSSIAQVRSDW